jgi:superfamily I DNA and RNA helicase
MEINLEGSSSDLVASELIDHLRANEDALGLTQAQMYFDFPLYKDEDGKAIAASVLVASSRHGVIAIQTLGATDREDIPVILIKADKELGHVFSALYSRLIRQRLLQKSRTELKFPVSALILAPNVDSFPLDIDIEFEAQNNYAALNARLEAIQIEEMADETFAELISVIEGAKGLIRPKPRDVSDTPENSKGKLANRIEEAITSFDREQKRSSIVAPFDGPQRIRGLAGSGKTVVLAWKAALTHLRDPEATIIYTFYTRSLYQHIRRLVTRFYRQFDDQDPDWNRLKIMHAWGGRTSEGVYYNACVSHDIVPLTYSDAKRASRDQDPFDFACKILLEKANLTPMYEYIFIDEGQDFPASFINLSVKIAEKRRVVWAYDDLQTIWQPNAPTPEEVFGTDENGNSLVELDLDTVLYNCYRNPREVLVCAHALGFGIYGKIVQMLENKAHWEDIGYVVQSGEFVEGSEIVIERPKEYSLSTISEACQPTKIVRAVVYDNFEEEIDQVAQAIKNDVTDGLRPDDILVVVVDDRAATNYLNLLSSKLAELGIGSNNIHADSYGIRDFFREEQVTLSTVHKAKGNEAFSVYVVGVDALFSSYAGVRERNMLFTAMTRAKGWVQVSGIAPWAATCKEEIDAALANFPYLRFGYPSEEELKIMKRDLTEKGIRKLKVERLLERALQEMDPEEIKRFIEQRSVEKTQPKERDGN